MIRVVAVVLVLAACKQAKEPAAPSEVLERSRALSAAMCACKDKACAAPLLKEWDDLTKLLHGATFTEEQVEGLEAEDTRFTRCTAAVVH
jgi:hypothetical protein